MTLPVPDFLCVTDQPASMCVPYIDFSRFEKTYAAAKTQIVELIHADNYNSAMRELALFICSLSEEDFFHHSTPGFEGHYLGVEHLNHYIELLLDAASFGQLRFALCLEPFLCFPVLSETEVGVQNDIGSKLNILDVKQAPSSVFILDCVADFILLCDPSYRFYFLPQEIVVNAANRTQALDYECTSFCAVEALSGSGLEIVRGEVV